MHYICPFNREQRTLYINKYLDTAKQLRKYHLDFACFESVEEYEDKFSEFKILDELSSVPFVLRMVMVILPQIVAQMRERRMEESKYSSVNQTYLSKQDIFRLFVQNYYNNEIQRGLMIDENFKLTLKQYFDCDI